MWDQALGGREARKAWGEWGVGGPWMGLEGSRVPSAEVGARGLCHPICLPLGKMAKWMPGLRRQRPGYQSRVGAFGTFRNGPEETRALEGETQRPWRRPGWEVGRPKTEKSGPSFQKLGRAPLWVLILSRCANRPPSLPPSWPAQLVGAAEGTVVPGAPQAHQEDGPPFLALGRGRAPVPSGQLERLPALPPTCPQGLQKGSRCQASAVPAFWELSV